MSTILVSIKQSVMAIIQNSTDHFCEWMKLRGSNSVYYTPWQVLANYGRPAWCGLECEFRMQAWNALHADRWKYRTQKIAENSTSGHHRTICRDIFATKARIDNRKKIC